MSRWSRASYGGWRGALRGLLLLALLAPAAVPARADAAPQVGAEAASAAKRAKSDSKHVPHSRIRRSALEGRVELLTKALDLDAKQQTALRKVLIDQRGQMQRIWSDESLPSTSRIMLTKGVSRHTGDRIRALLNPEQRKKYEPPPQDGTAPAVANARVEDWMQRGNVR